MTQGKGRERVSPIGRGLVSALIAALLCAGMFSPPGLASDSVPQSGDRFPDLVIPAPELIEEARYLGLDGKVPFRASQLRAEVVVFEVFSMYCPYCQKEAPAVNELYNIIQKRNLGDKVKIVGLGAGNSSFEVNAFRRLYTIAFPLIPDADFTLHRALGEVRTPYFIVVRIDKKGPPRVIYSQVGTIGDPAVFLDTILQPVKKRTKS